MNQSLLIKVFICYVIHLTLLVFFSCPAIRHLRVRDWLCVSDHVHVTLLSLHDSIPTKYPKYAYAYLFLEHQISFYGARDRRFNSFQSFADTLTLETPKALPKTLTLSDFVNL